MLTPDFTVIIPCYAAAATLPEAVNSVLAQSLKNLEIIIVDDGSIDGTPAVAHALAASDRRIRVIVQKNAGPAAARNRGISEARAALVAFLDADDRFMPNCLATHRAHFATNPGMGISFARVQFFDPRVRAGGRVSAALERLTLADVLGENPICTTSNLVARRVVFAAAGGFNPALKHAEDQEWVARVVATTRWRAAGLPDILVQYRTSPNGLSADLDHMQAGWNAMVQSVGVYAPDALRRNQADADALFNRFIARRALRTGQAALAPMLRAWRASPRALLTHQPRRTALTMLGVLATFLPGNPARALLAR